MLKLMIVEDEDLLRMGLTTCIDWTELGFELIGEAGDGVKAIELVNNDRPDVIITDIKMPHMDGIDMAEKIKSYFPEIRIIIISGYDEFEYARRALKVGVSEYILKPINLVQLKNVMTEVRNEIEADRKKKEEYVKLKNKKYDDMQSLRQQLYSKLLLRRRSIDELSDDTEQLDEYVTGKYYTAGLLTIQSFPMVNMECDYLQIIEMDKELENMVSGNIEKHLSDEEKQHLDILRANNGERLFCISYDTDNDVRILIRKIQGIFDSQNAGMEHIELSFGHVHKELEGLHNSYLNACKSNEMKCMRNWAKIGDSKESSNSTINYMNYDANNLLFEIRSGSREGIEKALKELQDNLSREKVSSHLQLIVIISNLYIEIIKLPKEVGGTIDEILGNPKQYYQNVIGKTKRNDMIKELEIICFLIHEYFEKISGSKNKGMIKRIQEYINEHFSEEELSMKDVADYAFISVTYLGMIIKKETGKTFIEYLTEIRIEKAKYFLLNTNMKSYEVAIACGYSTPAYFSTVFKGMCGVTPSEYRQKYMQNEDISE